jgi:hypothetical protein
MEPCAGVCRIGSGRQDFDGTRTSRRVTTGDFGASCARHVRCVRTSAMRALFLLPALILVACASAESAPPTLARLDFEGCVPWEGEPIDRVCVPREAREGAPLTFEAAGDASCGSSVERCSVRVEGRDVVVSLGGRTCTTGPSPGCSRASNRVVCKLPALDVGRYRVRYDDASGRADTLDVVADPRAATTCSLGERT